MNPFTGKLSSRSPSIDATAPYASNKSDDGPHIDQPLTPIEIVTLEHVVVAVVFGAWAFGGNAAWSRTLLAWWCSLGVLIAIAALRDQAAQGTGALRAMLYPLRWLWPLALLNVMVVIGALNPNFRELTTSTGNVLVRTTEIAWLPSSARPGHALRALWLFDAIYLTCFNLALVIRQRRALRGLLLVLGANALVLSVFGTLQKLGGAKGLYFGLVKSPNPAFFASFLYHNHWGAFILLMLAACLGLVWHYARRGGRDYRNFWHSPALAGLVLVFFLAATIPLSTSRSSSLLAIMLLGAAFVHWATRLIRRRREHKVSAILPIVGTCMTLAVAGTAIYWLARPAIEARFAQTQDQFVQFREQGTIGSRMVLYRDTWSMARNHPWFGWGMGSFPTVFFTYHTQESSNPNIPLYYVDAHSDWLQAFAELGFVGTALLGLHGLLPLLSLRGRKISSPLPSYLLGGCGLVLLHAWIEFPFGNPAVVLAWWLCFFAAVRYARLEPGASQGRR